MELSVYFENALIMTTKPLYTNNNRIFLSGKNPSAYGLTGNMQSTTNSLQCEECEEEKAKVFCKNCEQRICSFCDVKIHNKGKRAEHKKQKISSEFDPTQISAAFFLALSSAQSVLSLSCTNPEFVDKLLELIDSQLHYNRIASNETAIYIYYTPEDQVSESIINRLSDELQTLDHYALVDTANLQMHRETQEMQFNEEILKNITDDKVRDLAKCLLLLSKGMPLQRAFVFDHNHSLVLGSLLQSTESASDMLKVFILEGGAENTFVELSKKKLVELTPKKFMRFLNRNKQQEKHISSYSQETGDFKRSPLNSTYHCEHSYEQQEKSGDSSNSQHSSLAESNALTAFNNPNCKITNDLTLSQPANTINFNLFNRNTSASGRSPFLNQSFDHKNALNSNSNNINQSFDGNTLTQSTPYLDFLNVSSDQAASSAKTQKVYLPGMTAQRPTNPLSLMIQPMKDTDVDDSLKLSHYLQGELFKLAREGELMILKEQFVEIIKDTITKKYHKQIEQVFDKAEQAEVLHITTRKFTDSEPFIYIGLHLDTITIESLGWVIKSIKRDGMAPTEKLILSRIKECFGLKLEANVWKNLLSILLTHENSNKKLSTGDGSDIETLTVSNTIDPSTGAETYVIYLKGEEWPSEDLGTIDESCESWKVFTKFLEDFFAEDDEGYAKEFAGGAYNHHRHNTHGKYNAYSKYDRNPHAVSEGKAIPGGRYGCAQFIKACGPEALRKESLGKLNLYVQEAINKGILRYQRTLLVKNNQPGVFSFEGRRESGDFTGTNLDGLNDKRMHQLKKIKDALIEILAENSKGLSLAQIPQYLRRKLSFSFNLQDFGFPKLKNLLTTMTEDIKIELSGTNHSFASLKHPEKYSHLARRYNRNYEHFNNEPLPEPQNLFGYSLSTNNTQPIYQDQEPIVDPANSFVQAKTYVKKFNTHTPGAHQDKFVPRKKSMSTFEEYLEKVRMLISEIIMKISYGINIDQLYQRLSTMLGVQFDFRIFNCQNFYEFLINKAEDLVDIEVKKNFGTSQISYMIYPKNFRFRPPGMFTHEQGQGEQQHTPLKNSKPPLHSGTGMMAGFYNNTGYPLSQPQSQGFQQRVGKLPYPITTNPLQSKAGERLNISPLVLFDDYQEGAQNASPFQGEGPSPTPNRNESYWNLSFNGGDNNLSNISNVQHAYSDMRNTRIPEESHIEINENLRFIEAMLDDNDDSAMYSFSERNENTLLSPNLSYTAIQPNDRNRQKALSGDYNRTEFRQPPGLMAHGRGNSAFAAGETHKSYGSHIHM